MISRRGSFCIRARPIVSEVTLEAIARNLGAMLASKASRSVASPSRWTVNGARPLTIVGLGGPISSISIVPSAMIGLRSTIDPGQHDIHQPGSTASLTAAYILRLHQHRHRLLDEAPERGDEFGAECAVDHAVIARERHRHHAGEGN